MPIRKSAEEARAKLAELLNAAEQGRYTIITRRGKDVAEIGPPAKRYPTQKPFPDDLIGSGKGYWGEDSGRTLRELRDEWD